MDLTERLKPDLLILDLKMFGFDGLATTRQVRQRSPRTRILVLSMYANEAYVTEALKNGAIGQMVIGDCGKL